MKAGQTRNVIAREHKDMTTTTKNRKGNICFNPLYSANVATKVSPLYQITIFHRTTSSLKYLTEIPKRLAIAACQIYVNDSHNNKTTYPKIMHKERTCNCVDKAKYPLSQNYFISNIIFKLTSTSPRYKEKAHYVQLKLYSSYDI